MGYMWGTMYVLPGLFAGVERGETLLQQGHSHHTGNLRAGAHGSWLSRGLAAPQWFYKESRGYKDLGCRVHADEETHSRILPCSTYNLKAAHTGRGFSQPPEPGGASALAGPKGCSFSASSPFL